MIAFAEDRDLSSNFVVESHGAHAVLLTKVPIGERCCNRACVFIFGECSASITHAIRDVDGQKATKIRVFLKLFDVEPILSRPDFPVDMTKVISVDVLSMLPELDRLSKIRTAVHTG